MEKGSARLGIRKDGVVSLAEEKFKRAVGPVFECALGYSQKEGRDAAADGIKRTINRLKYIDNIQLAISDRSAKTENNHEPR